MSTRESASDPAEAARAVTEDRLLGGRLRVRQPANGYRGGMDAALLAAATRLKAGEQALEIGCGVGCALLQAALRAPEARLTGVERDPFAAALAVANVDQNHLADRVRILTGDVETQPAPTPESGRGYDLAFANPPFFDDPEQLRAPDPAKRDAWMTGAGLQAWTGRLLTAVRDGGRVLLIHRADRLADILALFGARAGSFQVRGVHPFADAPAKRVLVLAVKGGRAPLRLLPPLVLHTRDEPGHTPEAEAILRGEADLPWL